MQNGLVPDIAITASSSLDSSHGPSNARLNHKAEKGQIGGWVANLTDLHQWLQIDAGRMINITQIATQGRADESEWVTTYSLAFSVDGIVYTGYNNSKVTKTRFS